jgi:hypothetical protein
MADSKELVLTEGIVGFFDILGYTSFLENNSAEDAATEVLQTLNSIDKEVASDLKELLKLPIVATAIEDIEWLVFSDTILITYNYKNDDHNIAKLIQWAVFMLISATFSRSMFEYGLPVRGAVGFGEFTIQKNCFAGRPIIKAYQRANSLELSASVLCKSAEEELSRLNETLEAEKHNKHEKGLIESVNELISSYEVEYLVPLKDNSSEKLFALNIFATQHTVPTGDIRQYVLESFWKHKKDVPQSAQAKVENTEQFLRFLKSKTRGKKGPKTKIAKTKSAKLVSQLE